MLLTTWRLDRLTDDNRQQIQDALGRAGVRTQPPLAAVGEDDQVTLLTVEEAPVGGEQRSRRMPRWALVAMPVVVVLFVVGGLLLLGDDSTDQDNASETTTQPSQAPQGTDAQEQQEEREQGQQEQRQEGGEQQREPTDCDPNYDFAACVPIATDVDCAGSGNGPKYVKGPLPVRGADPYGLDPNRNRVACEPGEIKE
jgi:hypothetical protein